MPPLFWIIIFIISLVALVKGSDFLLSSAERIGFALGLSPFIVGVLIVGMGTSFPELASSFIASMRGLTDFAPANAIGSNLANILLVVGVAAVVGRRLTVSKNLIDVELPILAIGTVFFLGVVWDQKVTRFEAALMLVLYAIYLLYSFLHPEENGEREGYNTVKLPGRKERRGHIYFLPQNSRPKVSSKDFIILILGIIGLAFGSKYLIDSVVNLSRMLNIGTGVIALTAVAIGTSLPELLVSAKAALNKKADVALGNIFGSNAFNALVVVGLPAVFYHVALDAQTYTIALPIMALATLLFVISGISRTIHIWEGAFYLALYILFLSKLIGLS